MRNSFICVKTSASPAMMVGDTRIRLIAQSVRLSFPNRFGGVIWNRPVAVITQSSNGHEQRLAIKDITRLTQLAILISSVFVSLLIGLVIRKHDGHFSTLGGKQI